MACRSACPWCISQTAGHRKLPLHHTKPMIPQNNTHTLYQHYYCHFSHICTHIQSSMALSKTKAGTHTSTPMKSTTCTIHAQTVKLGSLQSAANYSLHINIPHTYIFTHSQSMHSLTHTYIVGACLRLCSHKLPLHWLTLHEEQRYTSMLSTQKRFVHSPSIQTLTC